MKVSSILEAKGPRVITVKPSDTRLRELLPCGPSSRCELVGRRGLVWRVSCAGGKGGAIGESQMTAGAAPRWKDIEWTFTVPDADCRAQQLRLELDARMASEQLVSGSIWYDELRISRIP